VKLEAVLLLVVFWVGFGCGRSGSESEESEYETSAMLTSIGGGDSVGVVFRMVE
jgi:uncharacterized spore protein YtfJ